MNAPAALAVALLYAAPVPFAERPAVEVWAGEDWPADGLDALSKLPSATLGIALRSNMIRPEAAAVAKRAASSLVRLERPALAPIHLDALRSLPRTTVVVRLSRQLDAALLAQLGKLGPQQVRVELAAPAGLDAGTARSLAGLKNAEVWLDARGRAPDQEELGLLLGLSRVRRVVRLRADDPPALVAALKTVRPVRLVVEALGGARVPDAMIAALVEAGIPTRVAIDLRAGPEDLRRLAALPQVSLEIAVSGEAETALPKVRALLDSLVAPP